MISLEIAALEILNTRSGVILALSFLDIILLIKVLLFSLYSISLVIIKEVLYFK